MNRPLTGLLFLEVGILAVFHGVWGFLENMSDQGVRCGNTCSLILTQQYHTAYLATSIIAVAGVVGVGVGIWLMIQANRSQRVPTLDRDTKSSGVANARAIRRHQTTC